MTSNVFGSKTRRTRAAKPTEDLGLAIGETDARVFTCPRCARPLADGTTTCPGCGTRLIMGVPIKRAGAILTFGAIIGFLLGGAVTASTLTFLLRGQTETGVAAGVPTVPTATTAAPTAALPTSAPVVPGIPPVAISALSGTAVVNGRIATDTDALKAVLATKGISTIEIARALRSLAADAALGLDLTGRMAGWPDAVPVVTELDALYRSMARTVREGLRIPLTDDAAYRATAKSMLAVLTALDDVDAASRTLASTVGLELPPIIGATAQAAPSTAP